MDKTKSKGDRASTKSTQDKAAEASSQDRDGTVWIRDDGAICVGNECITIKSEAGQPMELTIDPDKCPCEIEDALVEGLVTSVLSGKGITVSMKPKTKQK